MAEVIGDRNFRSATVSQGHCHVHAAAHDNSYAVCNSLNCSVYACPNAPQTIDINRMRSDAFIPSHSHALRDPTIYFTNQDRVEKKIKRSKIRRTNQKSQSYDSE